MSFDSLWLLFAEWSLKATVVFAAGALAGLLLRRTSAEFRHRLWMPLLLVVLLAPLLLGALPRLHLVPSFWQKPLDVPAPVVAGDVNEYQPLLAETVAAVAQTARLESQAVEPVFELGASQVPVSPPAFSSWTWRITLLAIWVCGVATLLLRLLVGSLRLIRLRSSAARQPVPQSILESTRRLRGELGVRREVKVLVSDDVRSAFAWGIFRPVIALPMNVLDWSDDEAAMVLRHEMVHLSRHDGLAALITRLAFVCHWFNPLAWWAARSVTNFREEACDRLVLGAGCDPKRYAQLLFQEARSAASNPQPLSATAVAETGTLERRVKMILNRKPESLTAPSQSRRRTHWASVLAFAAGLALVSLGLAQTDEDSKPAEPLVIHLNGKWFAGSELAAQLKGLTREEAAEHVISVVALDKVPASAIEQVAAISREAGIADMMFYSADDTDHPWWNVESDVEFQLKAVGKAECANCHDLSKGLALVEGAAQPGRVATVVTATGATEITDAARAPSVVLEETLPLRRKLEQIIVPSVDLADTPLRAVLEFLEQKSLELDAETPDPGEKGINVVLNGGGAFVETPITLNLKHVSLGQALNYVAQLAGAPLRIDAHAVVFEVPGRGKPGADGLGISAEEQELTETKITKVTLPSVEFSDTPLSAALAFLRQKSIELDTVEADPGRKGVNVVLMGGTSSGDKTITLRLKNIPLAEALRYTAELADMDLSIEGSAVVLRGRSDDSPLR